MARGWLHSIRWGILRPFFQPPKRVLRPYVSEGMTVLEVGCGSGYFTIPIARMVGTQGRVIAVDLNGDRVEELRRKATRSGLTAHLEARVCTDRHLAVGDQSGRIDFALAFYVMHQAADVARLLANVFEALRAGGRALVVEPGHHASPPEQHKTEAIAREVGFAIAGHPRIGSDWAVELSKP